MSDGCVNFSREDLMRLEALKLALAEVPGWAPEAIVERAEVFLAFLRGPIPKAAPLKVVA